LTASRKLPKVFFGSPSSVTPTTALVVGPSRPYALGVGIAHSSPMQTIAHCGIFPSMPVIAA
jgi:hypothetical protein